MGYKASGIALLIAGAVIYTFERAVANYVWVTQKAAVDIHGSGQYRTYPDLPGMSDVPFVVPFILFGVILFVIGVAADVRLLLRRPASPEGEKSA